MLSKLGLILLHGYGVLLTIACGGFLGANLAVFVPVFGEFIFNLEKGATPPQTYQRCMHGGWLAGAGLALVTGLLEARRRRSAKRLGHSKQHENAPRERYPIPRTVLGSAAAGAAGFGLLGAFLGDSFLLLWFSLAFSPFSPADWGSSVVIDADRPVRTSAKVPHGTAVHTTDHRVALYLFFGPTLVGFTGGGLVVGGATLVEKLKRRKAGH